ncbi:HIT-like domain-containing protein [Pelagophyceae sp. CCMP2097]|nr:HIT-like domain-containing protein [Pelagophyceae sp. CCMP2097]
MILYYLGVEPDEVAVVSPAALGGLQSAQFLALNPQGKMPTLLCRDEEMALPESDTIARFVGGKFAKPGAAFSPAAGSLLAAKADRIARHHDMYLAAIQTCLYREPVKGFLSCGTRDDALAEFVRQLDVLEDLVDAEGPYMLGAEPTHADAACFPTIAFAEFMLPLFQGREFKLGPKLTKWWQHMTSGADPVASRVYGELRGDLEKWQAKGRWAPILGAGLRDDAPATVFDKILDGSIPAAVVYEDDRCLAFKDVNPVSPQHLLLIPKKRDGLTRLKHATADHQFILGHLLSKVGAVAAAAGLEDYRVVVNDGAQAGQTVFHLHLHIIGGRDLAWPPG